MNQCKVILSTGAACKARPTENSRYCFRHNPVNKKVAKAASQKGGENRRLFGTGEEIRLESILDVRIFLAQVINDVWTGKVPVKVGSSIGFLTRCWLDVHEKADLETRIADLEAKMTKLIYPFFKNV